MNNNFILLVGKSGSGKTTIAQELYKRYGLSQVISYTTRPKRYPTEDNHIFLSEREFDNLRNVIGYTEYNGYRYCATSEQVERNQLYVIDPDGVEFFDEHYVGNKNIIVVYIDASSSTRIERMQKRGDGYLSIVNRIAYDEDAFNGFEQIADFVVFNNMDNDIDSVVDEVYNIWKNRRLYE